MENQIQQNIRSILDKLDDENSSIRVTASRALNALSNETSALSDTEKGEIIALLLKSLTAGSNRGRYYIVDFLGKLGDKRLIEPLSLLLKDPNQNLSFKIASVLAELGNQKGFEMLLYLLKEGKTKELKLAAASTIANLEDKDVFDLLLGLSSDTQMTTRQSAIYALGELGDKRAVTPLIQSLKDSNSFARSLAAEALGRLGDKQAVEPLILMLGDVDDDVRCNAIHGLGEIGDNRALPMLRWIEEHDRGEASWFEAIEEAAHKAIIRIKERNKTKSRKM